MLLAVDTSTAWVGLALYDGVETAAEMIWQTRSHHTVEVAPAIYDLLQRCGVKPTELRALAVAQGPGSFTSLRIGIAAVKGLALALRLPVIGIPSLDIIAAAQPISDHPLVAVLQAGRGRLAAGWYRAPRRKWELTGELQVVTAEQLSATIHSPTHIAGELSAVERQVLARKRKNALLASPAQSLRRPSFLAELAWQRWQAGQVDEVVGLSPIYLHTAEAIPE
jgi:tRNA threonylcarbamoyladenosine biosynthesis protein TsaB